MNSQPFDVVTYTGGRDEPWVEFRVRFTNGNVESVTEVEVEAYNL